MHLEFVLPAVIRAPLVWKAAGGDELLSSESTLRWSFLLCHRCVMSRDGCFFLIHALAHIFTTYL